MVNNKIEGKQKEAHRSFVANIPQSLADVLKEASEQTKTPECRIVANLMEFELANKKIEKNDTEPFFKFQARLNADLLDRFHDYAHSKKYTMTELLIALIKRDIKNKERG